MELLNIKKNIIIGTAQLGTNYGIANNTKNIIINDKIEFLNYCYRQGFKYFDTAYAYENSQKILGDWTKNKNVSPIISSKIPNLKNYKNTKIDILFNKCLNQLNTNKIENLFLHNPNDWQNKNTKKYINMLLTKNFIKRFGLSIYEKKDILIDPKIKILQIPANIFNQNIITSSKLNTFLIKGGIIHLRSVFLQGLLLMNPELIPTKLEKTKKGIIHFHNIAKELKINNSHLAIICIKFLLPEAKIIIGLDNIEQLKNLNNIDNINYKPTDILEVLKIAKSYSSKIWDTRNW